MSAPKALADTLSEEETLELSTRGRRTGPIHAVLLWSAHEDGALPFRAHERGPEWLRNLRNVSRPTGPDRRS